MRTVSYWLDDSSRPHFEAPPSVSGEVDVLVVGGGFTGLSCAYHLARTGTAVVVADAGRIGAMASGQNGGHLNNGLGGSYLVAKQKYGQELACELYHAYDRSVDLIETIVKDESIDCEFRRVGKLKAAVKASHFESLKSQFEVMIKEVDADLALVGPEAIRSEVQTNKLSGGLLYKKSAQMHMGRYSAGLAQAVVRHGGQVWEESPVTEITRVGNRYRIQTPRGTVTAREVVLATGTSRIGPFSWFKRRLVPVGSFIIVTEPLAPSVINLLMPNHRNVTTTANIGNYFRILPDNRMLFGGRAKFAAYTGEGHARSCEVLSTSLKEFFPQLANVKVDYCWGGAVDMTADRLPRSGTYRGMPYAMGYSGHGAQLSTYMGRHLAQKVLGHPQYLPFEDLPWPAIPGYFGWPWFLPAVGAYYRYKDRVS
ncbi:FAD-binding oxidoreductase [Rhizobium sp. NZLR11]|nr:FAD-binding oxidoreductase [Rhizobium sp. NZLR11]